MTPADGERDEQDDNNTSGRRLVVSVIVAGAFLLVTAGLWAAGGLRARPSGPEQVRAGHAVNQGLFDVQVIDARAGRLKLGSFDPPANLLAVRMKVTDTGDQSYGVSTFLDGVAAEPRHGTYLDADLMRSQGYAGNQVTSTIHPRLPVTLQLVWVLGGSTAPRTVRLALREWEYGQGFTTDEFSWSVSKQSPITAEVTVPVHTGARS